MKYDSFTDKQKQVFEAAKAKLSKESWFRGVCCDNFPNDKEIDEDFDDAVTGVMFETAMWDDPDFHAFNSGNPSPVIGKPKKLNRRLYNKYCHAMRMSGIHWNRKANDKNRRHNKWANEADKIYRRLVKIFGDCPLSLFE